MLIIVAAHHASSSEVCCSTLHSLFLLESVSSSKREKGFLCLDMIPAVSLRFESKGSVDGPLGSTGN